MLVLSRKKNESIVINNDITVTVVEIRGDKVRLGIVAPKEVPVHRQEVFDAIHGKPGAEPADLRPRTLICSLHRSAITCRKRNEIRSIEWCRVTRPAPFTFVRLRPQSPQAEKR